MESFDDPLLHHPLGRNFEVASFSRVCISVSRLLWELQDAIVTLPPWVLLLFMLIHITKENCNRFEFMEFLECDKMFHIQLSL